MFDFYHRHISPIYHAFGKAIFGNTFACRFEPTCSVYARRAITKYGIIQGIGLSVARIIRCNPFNKGGYDPVP